MPKIGVSPEQCRLIWALKFSQTWNNFQSNTVTLKRQVMAFVYDSTVTSWAKISVNEIKQQGKTTTIGI